jgi:uncharacterized integral membrane protein
VAPESQSKPGEPAQAPHSGTDRGRTAKTVGYVVLAVVVTIFLLRNAQSVEVDFVFASLEVPLFLVLLATLFLGAVLALGISGLRRRRKAKVKKPASAPPKRPSTPPSDGATP